MENKCEEKFIQNFGSETSKEEVMWIGIDGRTITKGIVHK
jgi:hypothetical protein